MVADGVEGAARADLAARLHILGVHPARCAPDLRDMMGRLRDLRFYLDQGSMPSDEQKIWVDPAVRFLVIGAYSARRRGDRGTQIRLLRADPSRQRFTVVDVCPPASYHPPVQCNPTALAIIRSLVAWHLETIVAIDTRGVVGISL